MSVEAPTTIADRPLIRPPVLRPLFPITSFVPGSACPHGRWDVVQGEDGPERVWVPSRRPPRGTSLVCMVCHKSGKEGHPGLKRDPFTDPRPDPKPSDGEEAGGKKREPLKPETRRERRARQFNALVQAAIIGTEASS